MTCLCLLYPCSSLGKIKQYFKYVGTLTTSDNVPDSVAIMSTSCGKVKLNLGDLYAV